MGTEQNTIASQDVAAVLHWSKSDTTALPRWLLPDAVVPGCGVYCLLPVPHL